MSPQQVDANGAGDGAGDLQGHSGERAFQVSGRTWIARVAGEGLGGTGRLATATFVIVQFLAEGEQAPRFEVLLPRGRFDGLFDSELQELLARARPLPPPAR